MYTDFIKNIRLIELQNFVIPYLKKDSKILEIGAGAGWQSKYLSELGFNVIGIDIAESNYFVHRVWNVIDYDGKIIPFEDNSFDVIFSSNVLEHIQNVDDFQSEISRVLKCEGLVIHILPSATWRLWTTITFPIFSIKTIFNLIINKINNKRNLIEINSKIINNNDEIKATSKYIKIMNIFLPHKHGERGTLFSEHFLFSKYKWKEVFINTKWDIKTIKNNKIFYTGNGILSSFLKMKYRKVLSICMGSTCVIFYLKISNNS